MLSLLLALACTTGTLPIDGGTPDPSSDTGSGSSGSGSSDSGSSDSGGGGASTDCAPPAPAGPGEVQTTRATFLGFEDEGVWSWRGLAYAQPPTGDLRWRPAAPPPCTEELEPALHFGSACPQTTDGTFLGDEDCLTLNVWAPADAEGPLPVLFFLHGGSHVRGSTAAEGFGLRVYDGADLARHGAVVVTANYRLGALGWLVHDSLADGSSDGAVGNYGLGDQAAALGWVRDNIAGFGGDPARVHAFGQSAGAVDLCHHVATARGAALISSATLMSGSCELMAPDELARETSAALLSAVDCGDAACLRQVPVETLFDALVRLGLDGQNGAWLPYADGVVLHDLPREVFARGEHPGTPVTVSTTSREWESYWPTTDTTVAEYEEIVMGLGSEVGLLALEQYPVEAYDSPDDALITLIGDYSYLCPARRTLAALHAGQAEPVWRSLFDHRFSQPSLGYAGTGHSVDLYYVFDHVDALGGTIQEQALADALQDSLVARAAAGAPDGAWPEWQPATDPFMRFATPPVADAGIRTEKCDWWDEIEATYPDLP